MKSLITTLAVCFISTTSYGNALQTADEAFNKEIQAMDKQLFDIAFNQCNIKLWKDIVL
ncbi:hypothetical protein [Kangiella koreensis]|uniref:hypothetical protein n=1 Tax=Kangiella koreensis TaxID=261964 RepID=UPI00019E783A|nr:hypothetical protein [Kangiella koreensis]